ncbi:glycosyltransferase family 4 protein [Flavobacterium qiangtangense]|uniref:Glycosyltransferase family 4 protein n=1 Tax=Flavobacterium qiangtangense TaxID=1442595 RepID=A0ABW1PRJ9_9FLAO
MKLLIISSAPLIVSEKNWKAYSPYAKELEIWQHNSKEIMFCCPIWTDDRGLLSTALPFNIDEINKLIEFKSTSFYSALKSIFAVIINLLKIFKAMKTADHIHLRCPGNVGLLGCIVQLFFPKKKKSAKYAGNWDPNAKQPLSYKLQRWILSNTFLTKNMTVLVYGEWPNQTKNVKPFFTASYSENDKKPVALRNFNGIVDLIFVGTLSAGKRPFYVLQLAEKLLKRGHNVRLKFFGEGPERAKLQDYIHLNNLTESVFLLGNKGKEEIKSAYQTSHFLILPSQSEGWPKVVAEAMFWGCLPIATPISCVANMIGTDRGGLLKLDLDKDCELIENLMVNFDVYNQKSENAMNWSRFYTLEKFDAEIKKLLVK